MFQNESKVLKQNLEKVSKQSDVILAELNVSLFSY